MYVVHPKKERKKLAAGVPFSASSYDTSDVTRHDFDGDDHRDDPLDGDHHSYPIESAATTSDPSDRAVTIAALVTHAVCGGNSEHINPPVCGLGRLSRRSRQRGDV
jgi:hypothetical protein